MVKQRPRPEYRKTFSVLVACLLLAALVSVAPLAVADETCNLNAIRPNFQTLIPPTHSAVLVEARRIDTTDPGPRTVGKDEAVFAVEYSRHADLRDMRAPQDFTFRSGWLLNSQFAFHEGEVLPIAARYDLPNGETYYALTPPGEPMLFIFAKPDGTLCTKVMNNQKAHVFLVREYHSAPDTKLLRESTTQREEPLVLKIIYLGTSGGIATFRELWTRQGQILHAKDDQFDADATRITVAGIDLTVSNMTASSVTAVAGPLKAMMPVIPN